MASPAGALRALRGAVPALLLTGLAAFPAAAQEDRTLAPARPDEVGMSAAVLAGGVGLYREAVERGDLVGAVLLVARNGRVVLHEAVGWRNRDAGLPMEKGTMLRMASNTKAVVAAGVAILAERERLRYTDLVRQHIPAFDNYRAGFIQVHHLLTHTSGFRIPTLFLPPEPGARQGARTTLQAEVARFGEVGAAVPPGTSFSYNNPGYNTLGALIELRSGQPLEAFLTEEIYRPLGMADSYHMETADRLDGKLDRMSVVYYERKEGRWAPGWTPGDPPQVPFVRASGGMISTAWDFAVFCQMFLNGGVYGGRRILRPETVTRMTTPHTSRELGHGAASYAESEGYGYGWSVAPDGVFSHGGSDGTFAWVDPSRQLIGLVFTQTPRGRNPVAQFRAIVNAAILPEPAPR
jgi:CubicO group peptidase (beta-lactamase class C family)